MNNDGRPNKYYVGDIGTEIIVDTCVDISASTVTRLLVQKPGGAEVEWDGTVENTTEIHYFTELGDFSVAGTYKLQSYVELSSGKWKGNTAEFKVYDKFT